MLTLKYDDGGVQRSLDLAIDSVSDLKPIFARFIKYLRPEIDKVFQAQGPGWAPLADSSMEVRKQKLEAVAEKIRSGSMRTLDRKLSSESGRVLRKLEKRAKLMDHSERGQKLLGRAQKSVERQKAIRAEFERITAGQAGPIAKPAKKLGERIERRQVRAEEKIKKYESGEVLGAIASSIGYEIKGANLEVFSHIPWAGAHNEGATVGHGARVPERKFLEWTPDRIAKLAEIAAAYVVEKLKK